MKYDSEARNAYETWHSRSKAEVYDKIAVYTESRTRRHITATQTPGQTP